MIRKDIVKQIIRDFHLAQTFPVRARNQQIPLDSGKIISLVGGRRCGKTSLLQGLINTLLNEVDKRSLVFINFEDERLDWSAEDLDLILQSYRELYPEQPLDQVYWFFDEIQNVQAWEKFIRRMYDSVSRRIFVTGSNGKVLSQEIASNLRGRTLGFEVFPLAFSEFLRFLELPYDIHGAAPRARILAAQERYLREGGFPEILQLEERLRIPVLQEYFTVLMYRDLLERYPSQNPVALKYFLKKVLATATKQISVNKIYNELQSQQIKIGKNTLYEFLDQLQNVYLGQLLYRHEPGLAARELGEKKFYVLDNGFLWAMDYRFSQDRGKALENTVYWEFRHRGFELSYLRQESWECDFVLSRRGRVLGAVQVCSDLSQEETRQREFKGLVAACQRLGLIQGYIVTLDHQEDIKVENVMISVLPYFEAFGAAPETAAGKPGSGPFDGLAFSEDFP